jgi:hypothetical protein
MESFTIVCRDLQPDDIVSQIRAVNTFPCVIHLYDRVFTLANKGEAITLSFGVEIGSYIQQEIYEKGT